VRRGAGSTRGPAVAVTVRDGVAWVELGRPATGNALDDALMAELVQACVTVEDDDAAQVVVLAPRGRDFCVGLPGGLAWAPPEWPDGVGAVAGVTKPVIAALSGAVRGWGLALALACDLRIAAVGATLEASEVGRGRLPGGGVTQRLARVVGPSRALAMMLLGERVPARDALAWGLVSQVVPVARLQAAVARTARDLTEHGPVALRFAKEAVSRALDLPLDEGIRLEQDLYVLLQTTADRREGVRSFLERRPPHYEGR
jgi:enoyl-CoA hydratase/carnithine racemase